MKRLLMYISVPGLILVGIALVFLQGGRFVTTDNAYVRTGILTGAARASGEVVAVHVKRNQQVAEGDVIAELDDTEARLKLMEAQTGVTTARDIVAALKANYRKSLAMLAKERENLAYEMRELKRAEALVKDHNLVESKLDEHKHLVEESKAQIAVLEEAAALALTQLAGDANIDPDLHPMTLKAISAVKSAEVALEYRQVRARTAGTVTQIDLYPGEYVTAGYPIFGMTVDTDLRIEANLKETELTYVQDGQDVEVRVDALPGQTFHAFVRSIDPATGAEFAVLPAQNATGNWVKVTQRVPVQIGFKPGQDLSLLRAGLSVEVDIDTHHERTTDDLLALIGLK
ncbi:MAG: HlyD family secretion protein [Alphaproteobacteria bacterium]|nr:MAG: HlyD family secretion protein [Alphaproteobacteria bacterium]